MGPDPLRPSTFCCCCGGLRRRVLDGPGRVHLSVLDLFPARTHEVFHGLVLPVLSAVLEPAEVVCDEMAVLASGAFNEDDARRVRPLRELVCAPGVTLVRRAGERQGQRRLLAHVCMFMSMHVRRGGDIAWESMTVVVVLVRLNLSLRRVSTGGSGDGRRRGGVDGETETELGGERRGQR